MAMGIDESLVQEIVRVIPTEWFEESKNFIGGIAYPANRYGKRSIEGLLAGAGGMDRGT